MCALGFHWAEVGVIGLTIIIMQTAFNGITEEHRLGAAFTAALPFTALLVVFFGVVSVIGEQALFAPLIDWVLQLQRDHQAAAFFLATGVLSSVSDNVFVATIYITEIFKALQAHTIAREHFDLLAIAINTGTNLPSVATPNGQAAFLFRGGEDILHHRGHAVFALFRADRPGPVGSVLVALVALLPVLGLGAAKTAITALLKPPL